MPTQPLLWVCLYVRVIRDMIQNMRPFYTDISLSLSSIQRFDLAILHDICELMPPSVFYFPTATLHVFGVIIFRQYMHSSVFFPLLQRHFSVAIAVNSYLLYSPRLSVPVISPPLS